MFVLPKLKIYFIRCSPVWASYYSTYSFKGLDQYVVWSWRKVYLYSLHAIVNDNSFHVT